MLFHGNYAISSCHYQMHTYWTNKESVLFFPSVLISHNIVPLFRNDIKNKQNNTGNMQIMVFPFFFFFGNQMNTLKLQMQIS